MKQIITFIFLLTVPLTTYAESVRIQVLDRGQADGIVIRTPNKQWVVIDAGTSKAQAELMKNDLGVDSLKLAIVSHRHRDHLGGMDDVLIAIPTEKYIGINTDCPTVKSDDAVRKAITDNNVTVETLQNTPKEYIIDSVKFTVFPLPELSKCPNKENMNSILVRMDYGEFSMLFAGDTEDTSLDWYVEHYPELLDVDVLKASHHGSKNGYTDAFLQKVTPERIVISAGVHGTYKHPQEQAVNAYLQASNDRLYCTNRHGSIRIFGYADGRVRVYKQRNNHKSCVYDGEHY